MNDDKETYQAGPDVGPEQYRFLSALSTKTPATSHEHLRQSKGQLVIGNAAGKAFCSIRVGPGEPNRYGE